MKACPFGAIDVVNGVAVVDKEACKACGKCVAKCPKHLIELVPYEQTTFVQCSSHAKVRLLLLRVRLAVSDVRSVRRLARMGRLRLIISVRILIIVSVRIVGLVKRFVRDILFSNGRKNCCVKAWRFFFRLRRANNIREYMFAL